MGLAKLILVALQVSVFLTVFSLGLSVKFSDALSLWGHPKALLRSLAAMFVVMPLFAVAMAKFFDLNPAVELALLVLAVSPVPPILPRKGTRLGAHSAFSYGLLVETALLSVVVTPLAVVILSALFGQERHVPAAAIALVIVQTVLLPLGLGGAFRRLWPATAARLAGPMSRICLIVLVAGAALLVAGARHEIGAVMTSSTVIAIAGFTIVGLAVGQLLGGQDREDTTFLAIATATRHPGVALAVAHAVAPGQKLVLAAVLLYLLVTAVVAAPYMKWRSGGGHAAPAEALPHPSR